MSEGLEIVRWRFILVGPDRVRAACTSLESMAAAMRLLGSERSAPMTVDLAELLPQPVLWPIAHHLSPKAHR